MFAVVSATTFFTMSGVFAQSVISPDRVVKELLSDPRGPSQDHSTLPIEFVERVAEITQQQPEVARVVSGKQEASYRVDEARSAWLPQINAGFDYRSSIQELDTRPADSGSRVDAVATASQLIYDFGATHHRISAAENQTALSQSVIAQTQESTILELLSAHYTVIRRAVELELAEQNLARHRLTLSQITEQVQGGAASTADLFRAESQVQSSQADVVSIDGALQRAAAVYQELYLEPPKNLRIYPAGFTDLQPVGEAIAQAQAKNAELSAGRLSVSAARDNAIAAKRDRLPELSVQLEARRLDVNNSDRVDTESFVLVNVDYPLFTGGAASARTRQAAERLSQQQSELRTIKREVDRSIREIYSDARRLDHQLVAQYLTVEAEKQTVDAYKEQFGIGRRTLNDVIEAQQTLFNAQRQLVSLRIQDRLIEFEMKALTGQLLSDFKLDER